MRIPQSLLATVLGSVALTATAADDIDIRRITSEEIAQLGPSQLLVPLGRRENLVHVDVRSAYDPTELARDASLAGSFSGAAVTAGVPIAFVSIGLAAGIIHLNEPNALAKLRKENWREFVANRTALGDYDCRAQLARELDWQLAAVQPQLKVERVRVTDDGAPGMARAYALEPVDTLIVVDATCGLSIDLGDARIDVDIEIFSKRFGPLAHAVEREEGEPAPAVWHEEPVYRNRFVGRVTMPTADLVASRIAARESEIEARYQANLAKAQNRDQRAEVEKRRRASLMAAKDAGRISFNEYIELARAHWPRGQPTELQQALDQAAKLVARAIAEDLGQPPPTKGKRKKQKAWVLKRPIVLEAKDD